MATTKFFSGDVELGQVHAMNNAEFAKSFPGVKGVRYDGFGKMIANPKDFVPVYDRTLGRWTNDFRAVERVITYKSSPSKHECDARCMNATGKTMQCECSCGGRNHGAGAFRCIAA